ncbi:transposase [Pedobacter sp. AK017]|uniref:hypothetical protein n=1 Tax=Pedobacter sp. AK017 TaxID=2723073 RepID=UPI001607DBD2|nr:hypothetical protein [Pedobacter sp. AK017]MBB5441409.1 transposase [Pedobacter sp. AK017]
METTEKEFIFSERGKGQPYDKRLIKQVIDQLREGVPRREVMQKYGMVQDTLIRWIQKYAPDLPQYKSYSTAEKRTVVRAVASGGMTFKQAKIAFNITHESMIRRWAKDFKEENIDLSSFTPKEMPKKKADLTDNSELKALRKALEQEVLKNKALNTMIDIAEQQLKIDIRKKSGARQSSK